MKTKTPEMDVRQEVRFAVVMYGGVSLAIYINGIAQELFRMVRATAAELGDPTTPLLSNEELSGSERVYRELGQILGREGKEREKPWNDGDPIHTRFVVDILSGSSAGGINAIYLAKALANGQDMGRLKQLWVKEGDIEKLINDKGSLEGLEDILKVQKQPKSLLNSQRMYLKLLEALQDMDDPAKSPGTRAAPGVPHVEELDLFVTATDMRGLPVPLKLAGQVVWEKRHRNVFRFRYSKSRDLNDFDAKNNAFLAFAARCTSAFPFAFEPMKLSDIDPMLETPSARDSRWQKYFPAYRKPPGMGSPNGEQNKKKEPGEYEYEYETRAFGDGGYLDNKPFGYAIDALSSRHSSIPVDRKLVYIEPSPEHPERQGRDDGGQNAIENVAAASSLARYETIREDLQRILSRNRLIERVESIIADSEVERDVQNGRSREGPIKDEDFRHATLDRMTSEEGGTYEAYHRLRVAAVTDDIAAMITCAAGFDIQSDEFFAIRYLVRAWRNRTYAPNGEKETETQNTFLVQYDLAYRLRRLNFLLDRIDRLHLLDGEAKKVLKPKLDVHANLETDSQRRAFRAELTHLRGKLSKLHARARRMRDELETTADQNNPLREAIVHTSPFNWDTLREILEEPTEQTRANKARVLMSESARARAFENLASKLSAHLDVDTVDAAAAEVLGPPDSKEGRGDSFAAIAREIASDYYHSYLRYDQISYPILYSTEVGEERNRVQVTRVSPEDACFLDGGRLGPRKLAGTAFRNFGAFLDSGWRRNDILWGRLDGAERIITTLLPESVCDAKKRGELIRKAQIEILEEEFRTPDRERLLTVLANLINKMEPEEGSDANLKELVEQELAKQEPRSSIDSVFNSTLRTTVSKEALYDFFSSSYEPNRELDPKTEVRTLSRSTQVTGKILEGIAGEHDKGHKLAAWVARFGQVFAGLVEVSSREKLWNLIWRRWLVLLYAFEAFLILAGLLFSKTETYQFGLTALGITAALHIGTLALGDYMRARKSWYVLAFLVPTVVVIGLAGLGIYYLVYHLLDSPPHWLSKLISSISAP